MKTDPEIFELLAGGGRDLLGGFAALTEAQREAIPDLVEGRAVMLVARTASGKTEAVLAPLLTRAHRERWTGMPSILYVAPTRALVNDLQRRLEHKLSSWVSVGRRTGEYRETESNLLVTTPESLDSMLARGTRVPEGHYLEGVRAVVLDELHLIAEGPRGTQLQALLARLDEVADAFVQRVAISATVPDPRALATRFLGPDALVRTGAGGRPIRIDGVDETSLDERPPGIDPLASLFLRVTSDADGYAPLSRRLLEIRRELGSLKALVFVPSRSRCDLLTGSLSRAFQGRAPLEVHAHHGSLDRDRREDTEQELADSDEAIAVATSTLEVGIDIGDVGLVVLDGPPGSVSSLLQRVGRANRRSETTFVVPVVRNDVEACTLASMLRAAVDGKLDPVTEVAHYSVVLQQIASIMRQARTPGRKRAALEPILSAAFGTRASWIVDRLVEGGWLREFIPGAVQATPALAEIMDSPFRLHCNIDGGGGMVPLVDAVTGQPMAWIPRGQTLGRLVVAGQAFDPVDRGDVVEMHARKRGGIGEAVRYANRAAPIGAAALAHLRRGLGLPEDALVEHSGAFFHFGGAIAGRLLSLAGIDADPLRSGVDPRSVTAAALDEALEKSWERIEALCGFGPFQRQLPPSVRRAAVIETIRAHRIGDWLARLIPCGGISHRLAAILDHA